MNGLISSVWGGYSGHSYSLSFIRFFSLQLIITCHIFQYLDNELAWWFNVGVQIFLCISGYLYGQKNVGDIKDFYSRRFRKILVPFYIVSIPAVFLNFLTHNISLITAGLALLLNTTFSGAGHLWFVPTILLCYVITPILQSFYWDEDKKRFVITTIMAMEIAALFCFGFIRFYNGAWIGCYMIGYALGVNERGRLLKERSFLILFGILAAMNVLQIYIDYIAAIEFSGPLEKVYSVFKLYNHVWLGVFLFLLLKHLLDRVEFPERVKGMLDKADEYSYEIYLVHEFLILGPFSLMALTPWLSLNILVILVGIVVLACMVKKLEGLIMRRTG